MDEHANSDTAHGSRDGHHRQADVDTLLREAGGAGRLFDPGQPPRRFALCDAHPVDGYEVDEELDEREAAELAGVDATVEDFTGRPDLLDLEEPVMWGLAYPEEALVYARNPFTGARSLHTFASAERARAFFSHWGELRLIYI